MFISICFLLIFEQALTTTKVKKCLSKFIILLSDSFYPYHVCLEWTILENKASVSILNPSFSHFLKLIIGIWRRFCLYESILLFVYIFGKSFEGRKYWLGWLRLDWDNLWIRFPVVILDASIFLLNIINFTLKFL